MENRLRRISLEKETFIFIFLILVLVLLLMPFITTFNDLLTRLVMRLDFYKVIQKIIVPQEIRMVGVILLPFGFKPAVMGEYLALNKGNNQLLIEVAWNCVGWQSLLFFIITAFVGLQGDKYTNLSKLKTLVTGLLGTFIVNLFRIALVVLVAYWFGQKTAIIFHDYGSTIAILVWLFFFWWFSYAYVLNEKIIGRKRKEAQNN